MDALEYAITVYKIRRKKKLQMEAAKGTPEYEVLKTEYEKMEDGFGGFIDSLFDCLIPHDIDGKCVEFINTNITYSQVLALIHSIKEGAHLFIERLEDANKEVENENKGNY